MANNQTKQRGHKNQYTNPYVPSYSPYSLVNQSALRKSCRRAKYKTFSPLHNLLVILSTSKTFYCCLRRQNSLRFWSSLVYSLDLRRELDERFLQKHIIKNDISISLDKSSEYDLQNFHNFFFRSLWYL